MTIASTTCSTLRSIRSKARSKPVIRVVHIQSSCGSDGVVGWSSPRPDESRRRDVVGESTFPGAQGVTRSAYGLRQTLPKRTSSKPDGRTSRSLAAARR
jgi:hypothetical protein